MKIRSLIAFSLMQMAFLLDAKSVISTPGGLSSVLAEDRDLTVLAVEGSIDASDLRFIADSLPMLTSLDLSQAEIVAYSGSGLLGGLHEAPAGQLPSFSLAGLRASTVKLPAKLTRIGECALAASDITSIEIPAGVSEISMGAFDGCRLLAEVVLPEGLGSISPLMFKGCSSLKSISIPTSVATIGPEAFRYCTGLRQVDVAGGISVIDSLAFASCGELAEFDFPKSLVVIGADAFQATGLRSVYLQDNDRLSTIGDYAFSHCNDLTEAVLPSSVESVGEGVFFDCRQLATVMLPESVTTLAPYIFKGTALATAEGVLQPDITTIGAYALHGNKNIVEITLPAGLDSIGDHAMAGLTSLEKIDATDVVEVPALGADVFLGTPAPDVTLLASEDFAPVFSVTPQWQEFNIRVSPGDTGTSTDLVVDGNISIRYDGSDIHIVSDKDISSVSLYDTNGVSLGGAEFEPAGTSVSVAAPSRGRVIILRVVFDAGGKAKPSTTLKIRL